jgi:hypothetical protein
MPSRWLLPLVLAVAPVGVAVAQQPLPPGEPLPDLTGVLPPPTEPPAGPCPAIIPPVSCRPRCQPDYVQFLTGTSRTTSIGPNGPDINFTPMTARLGWYICDPMAPGAWSVLLDTTADIVTGGPGNWFAGPSVLLRYERRPDRVIVPYVQVGFGFAFNDVYRDQTQRAIGAFTEFHEHVAAGVRYRFTTCWSFDVEGMLEHISNGGTAHRNGGITNAAVLVGVSYNFGGP